jgi:Domain of unknown function (DUF3854)
MPRIATLQLDNPTHILATIPTIATATLATTAPVCAESGEPDKSPAPKFARRAPAGALTNLEGLPPWYPSDLYINAKHLADLRSSGWTDETARHSRVYSASAREVKRILGFVAGPGLVFMYGYFDAHVKPDYRPKSGKVYYSAKGSKCLMYIPAMLDWDIFKDPTQDLFITEGEKKAVAAVQEGIPCVAFSGVWTWRQDGKPIDDLDIVTWQGRKVYIVFDSDAARNYQIQQSEQALKIELESRGADVSVIRLPANGSKKVGLDDYLLLHKNRDANGVKSALVATCDTHPPISYKSGDRNVLGERDRRGNVPAVAEYLWNLWGQSGPLALDTPIHSPLDPNKRRAGTRFVDWKGQVRVQVEDSKRSWPLPVAWYNGLRRARWTGGRFKVWQLSKQDLPVWDAILRHRAGETILDVEPLHPAAATLPDHAQHLLMACAEEVAARRPVSVHPTITFSPGRLSLLSGLTESQVKSAWDAELRLRGFIEDNGAEKPLYVIGSDPITDEELRDFVGEVFDEAA